MLVYSFAVEIGLDGCALPHLDRSLLDISRCCCCFVVVVVVAAAVVTLLLVIVVVAAVIFAMVVITIMFFSISMTYATNQHQQ